MVRISRQIYHDTVCKILRSEGFELDQLSLGSIVGVKEGDRFHFDVVGKNLPYIADGKSIFVWETHVRPDRLERDKKIAQKNHCVSWLALCYIILEAKYQQYFDILIRKERNLLGARFIQTNSYIKNMQSRSPSWDVVELPREKVQSLTYLVSEI